jgi:hypothetical protein
MSAVEALRAAHVASIELGVDGEDLVLTASVPPPGAVIDLLARFKTEVLALLRPTGDGWSAEDWRVFFDERAGMGEFDGGLSRAEAEAHAFACCVTEWLNHNPAYSPAGHCLGCGNPEYAHDSLLPFGAESTGHAWLHSHCWPTWHEVRKAEAVTALAAMGISLPHAASTAPVLSLSNRAEAGSTRIREKS